jgi:hypothetical protein
MRAGPPGAHRGEGPAPLGRSATDRTNRAAVMLR